MTLISREDPGAVDLLMGNEAVARGALEAGVRVCAAYPGNPSSEILGVLGRVARERDLHVEWSVNEKVALEVAAAASFAGLRGLCTMKQNGLNVAADFLFNLNLSGTRGGLVLLVADDPGALSSSNEEDSRGFSRIGGLPLLELSTFHEAKEMTKWAFTLSEELGLPVLVRSVTRVSHARGNVTLGELPKEKVRPRFDPQRPFVSLPVVPNHQILREKLARAREIFEASPFNFYRGPEQPDLLVITSGSGWLYCLEALVNLGLEERVGVLKLGTTWPLPENLVLENLKRSDRILFLEEVDSFLEDNVKSLFADHCEAVGLKRFLGKADGTIPGVGELNPDLVTGALADLLGVAYEARPADYATMAKRNASDLVPARSLGFCAGCPHRATFWSVHNALAMDGREGFLLGDIGCYSLAMGPTGFGTMKTLHAMGSGTGLACGFGQLHRFGLDQPVLAVCGDSTFYHAVMPALANGLYNGADFLLLLLDNSATAMTGFQPHPGTGRTASGEEAPVLALDTICEALGARVEVTDPFEVEETTKTILRLMEDREGVKVLILRRECALVRSRRQGKIFHVTVDPEKCLADRCGCNRLCTRVFRCPGLVWDKENRRTQIDEAICTGCGVCADICPASAIRKEVA